MAAVGKVEGEAEVLRNLNRQIVAIEGRTLAGLLAAGLIVEGEAKKRCPVDTGNLRASGYTRKSGELEVEVGFSASYAVYVHENLEANHKVGQAKFLQSAVEDKAGEVLETVQKFAKVSGGRARDERGRFI